MGADMLCRRRGPARGTAAWVTACAPRPTPLALLLALALVAAVLAGCAQPRPGLPRVWAGQSLSPNGQVRSGDRLRLTIRATNDSPDRDNGGARAVRAYTAYPAGVTVLDFTSSDRERLAPGDPGRAWVERIDTANRVIVIGFGPLAALEQKTVTLTLAVSAPPGAALDFRTMLTWDNAQADTFECRRSDCEPGDDLRAAALADPQVRAYAADHPAEVEALLRTYQGGGGGLANAVSASVGEANRSVEGPAAALLLGDPAPAGRRATARAVFTPNEPAMLWYNLPGGAAVPLGRTDALDDGGLDWIIDAADWDRIPATATGIVAHGQYSGVEAIYLFNR